MACCETTRLVLLIAGCTADKGQMCRIGGGAGVKGQSNKILPAVAGVAAAGVALCGPFVPAPRSAEAHSSLGWRNP